MPKLKKGTIIPTEKENEAINQGIAQDADTYELADDEFKQLKRVGRTLSEVTKDRVTIRLSQEVTEYFRATGKGWQTRIDEILIDYVESQLREQLKVGTDQLDRGEGIAITSQSALDALIDDIKA